MNNYVYSADIRNRKRQLENREDSVNESSSIYPSRYCTILAKKAKNTNNMSDIMEFFKECSKSSANANTYITECIEFTNNDKNNYYSQFIKANIVPLLDDYTVNDIYESYTDSHIGKYLANMITKNTLCDNILSNHEKICEVCNIDKLLKDSRYNNDYNVLTKKICSIVDKFNMPVYGKLECTINECAYLFNEMDNRSDTINEAFTYFCISNNVSKNDIENMKRVVENLPTALGYTVTESSSYNEYAISYMRGKFISNTDYSIDSIDALKSSVMSDIDGIKVGFESFLNTLLDIITASDQDDLIEYICVKLFNDIHNDIITDYRDNVEIKNLLISIESQVDKVLEKAEDLVRTLDKTDSLYRFIDTLNRFKRQIQEDKIIVYPSYNMECMNSVLVESANTISLEEFKVFKYDNIVTKLWKVDKFLQRKFNNFKKSLKGKIYKIKSKIFDEESIYEFIDSSGNIDYCIESFRFNTDFDEDFEEIHNRSNTYIREINETILNDSEYICYYEIAGNDIEFRLKTNKYSLSLTESQQEKANELSTENMDRLVDIIRTAELLNENFDFINQSIEYFSDRSNIYKFGLYLDECALAGIDKDIIKQIYESILLNYNDPTSFIITNSYHYNSYRPDNDLLVEVSLDAMIAIETLLEDGNNLTAAEKRRATIAKKNEEQLRKWEEEEEENEDEEEEEDNDKEDNKKQDYHKPQKPDSSTKKPVKDKEKDSPTMKIPTFKAKELKTDVNTGHEKLDKAINTAGKVLNTTGKVIATTANVTGAAAKKGMSFLNTMRLYTSGLRQYAKKAGSEIRTKVMAMDSSTDRLTKSIRNSLQNKRREAIIKGSVIPSFHECIASAIALAGLWAFNPPIAIISAVGAFAVSKDLNEKEKSLMYDDIMIELKIVEKEIQMAEDHNQIKKLRELMRIQKELERQATRIKLGSRAGRKIALGHTKNRLVR